MLALIALATRSCSLFLTTLPFLRQLGLVNKWTLTESCVVDCPISCILSDWTPWTECSRTCGSQGKETEPGHNKTGQAVHLMCLIIQSGAFSELLSWAWIHYNLLIFISICNSQPHYTENQCATLFFSPLMYVLIFSLHYLSPVFLIINSDIFALWGDSLRKWPLWVS